MGGWIESNLQKMHSVNFAAGDHCSLPVSNHECHVSNSYLGQFFKNRNYDCRGVYRCHDEEGCLTLRK